MMAKVIKRCTVDPISSSLQLRETSTTEVNLIDRQNTISSPADVTDKSCTSRVTGWFSSMRFDDKRLEVMYDSYVMKFGEYSVNMLMLLLSLCCLTELIFYFALGTTYYNVVSAVLLMSLLVILIFTQVA